MDKTPSGWVAPPRVSLQKDIPFHEKQDTLLSAHRVCVVLKKMIFKLQAPTESDFENMIV
jgi:hypothetical protein